MDLALSWLSRTNTLIACLYGKNQIAGLLFYSLDCFDLWWTKDRMALLALEELCSTVTFYPFCELVHISTYVPKKVCSFNIGSLDQILTRYVWFSSTVHLQRNMESPPPRLDLIVRSVCSSVRRCLCVIFAIRMSTVFQIQKIAARLSRWFFVLRVSRGRSHSNSRWDERHWNSGPVQI